MTICDISTPLLCRWQWVVVGLVAFSLGLDLSEQQTTLQYWTLGATVSFCGVTWDDRLTVLLGILFQRVLVCDVTTLETDMSFWCLTCLSIPSFLVWTWGLESSFDCSTVSYLPVPCRLLTWPLQWWISSSLWTHWSSLGWKGSVLAWSLYRESIWCPVGMEVAISQSRRGCYTGTLRWIGGHTSHPVIC